MKKVGFLSVILGLLTGFFFFLMFLLNNVAYADQTDECIPNTITATFTLSKDNYDEKKPGTLILYCTVLRGSVYEIIPLDFWDANAGDNNATSTHVCEKDKGGPLPSGNWTVYYPRSNENCKDGGALSESVIGYSLWKTGICGGRCGFFIHGGKSTGCIAVQNSGGNTYAAFMTMLDSLITKGKITTEETCADTTKKKTFLLTVNYIGFASLGQSPNLVEPSASVLQDESKCDCSTCAENVCGPVGGIAELPEIAGSEAAMSETTSTNYALWAVIAAATAGSIGLITAIWYARRRSLS